MKYTIKVTVNVSRDRFLELFESLEFMKQWQPALEKLEHFEGEKGENGAVSYLHYKENGKPSVIKETIINKQLPNTFDFLYEADGVTNYAYNQFIDQGDSTTWIATHQFKFSLKLFFLNLMKKAFTTQTTKDMEAFKAAAEKMNINK